MNLYGYEIQRDSDLMHHGIKGQKWGIRRYQNEDGSLTNRGKSRYGHGKEVAKEHTKLYYDKLESSQKKSKAYQKAIKESERLKNKYDLDNENDHSLDSKLERTEREWAAQKRWSYADDIDAMDEKFQTEAKKYADSEIVKKYGDVGLSDMNHYQAVNTGIAFMATGVAAGLMALVLRKVA